MLYITLHCEEIQGTLAYSLLFFFFILNNIFYNLVSFVTLIRVAKKKPSILHFLAPASLVSFYAKLLGTAINYNCNFYTDLAVVSISCSAFFGRECISNITARAFTCNAQLVARLQRSLFIVAPELFRRNVRNTR